MLQTLFNHGNADVSTCACSRCGSRLPASDINVTADTALCRQCGGAYRFSELVHNGNHLAADLAYPPSGASFKTTPDGFVAHVTTRSAEAVFLLPFMMVWSGFSLNGIYGSQFRNGQFDLRASVFGIPFILGTILMGTRAIMLACGRITLTRSGDEGSISQGVWLFGWKRHFRWSEIESVAEGAASYGPRRGPPYRVVRLALNSNRRSSLSFGTMLSEERRWFVISLIRSQLGSLLVSRASR